MSAGTHGQTGFVLDETSLSGIAGRALGNFAPPLGILGAAVLLALYSPELPDFLAVLKVYAPYFTLGAALLISLAFKRGRAFFAVLSLLVAYASFRLFPDGDTNDFAGRTVFAALTVFVPFNLALLSLVHERGALNPYGARRLALVMVEIGVTAAVLVGGHQIVTEALYRPIFGAPILPGSPIPPIGLVAIALALVVSVAGAVTKSAVIESALSVAIAAFAAACHGLGSLNVFGWLTTAGIVLAVAVLQDSYRMAFRDELTGLPGRRALSERLLGLPGHFTVAMLDVDHFKGFNDRWGHDVGDQVLRLVASKLGRVGGGGRAFRYGGEEFTMVFPGRRLPETLSRVERLRGDIEAYRLQIRAKNRPAAGPGGAAKPSLADYSAVSVTVSIGVAEKSERLATPDEVLKAADQALYRAKESGRNRVSR